MKTKSEVKLHKTLNKIADNVVPVRTAAKSYTRKTANNIRYIYQGTLHKIVYLRTADK